MSANNSAVDEVAEALSVHVAPRTIQIIVVPARVTVLLVLHNLLHSWTSTVGPSVTVLTIALV
jgi:hypothetical protein